jgi:hypoxanthine phosphoribosyltransferase
MAPNKTHYTWKQIEKMSVHLADLLESGRNVPDYIIGVSRGGCIPATIISHKLNVPMIPVQISTRDHVEQLIPDFAVGNERDHYRFLVVDDINDTGHTFNKLSKILEHRGCHYLEYAVLIDNEPSTFNVDYWAEKINKEKKPTWIVYPWEV